MDISFICLVLTQNSILNATLGQSTRCSRQSQTMHLPAPPLQPPTWTSISISIFRRLQADFWHCRRTTTTISDWKEEC